MSRTLLLVLLVILPLACDGGQAGITSSADLAAGLAADSEGARIVCGAPGEPVLDALLERLAPGVRVEGDRWVIGERRFALAGAVLVAVFEDPEQPGRPVTLAVASEPERVQQARARLVAGWRPGVELWRLGERVLTARLSARGALRVSSLAVRDLDQGFVAGSYEGVRFLREEQDVPEEWVRDYLDRARAAVDRAAWAGVSWDGGFNLVARGSLGPHQDLGRFDTPSRTLFVGLGGAGDDGGRALVQGLLHEELGSPGSEWAHHGAVLAATRTLYGRSIEAWPMAGFHVPWEKHVSAAQAWMGMFEDAEEQMLRAQWLRVGELDGGGFSRPYALPPARPLGEDWRGSVGGEAPAVLLRTEVAARPGFGDGGPWGRDDVTLEGDDALLLRLWRAQAAGQRVALEVVLLASPSGTFDGGRVLTQPEAWREHFEQRATAVRRVALLAELGGVDLLLVGGGEPGAAATLWTGDGAEHGLLEEAREVREQGWRAVIEGARGAFSGPLGFVADLTARADAIGFWEQLDLIVLSLQRPRASDPAAQRRRLGGALARAKAYAEEHERPWLLLAEGFGEERLDALIDVWSKGDEGSRGLGLLLGDPTPRQLKVLLER